MSLVSVSELVSDWDGSIPQVCTRTQFAEALHKDIWNSYSDLYVWTRDLMNDSYQDAYHLYLSSGRLVANQRSASDYFYRSTNDYAVCK